MRCPKCKTGDIIQIRARGRGRPFYGCTNYRSEQACDFKVWQEPVKEACPQCGSDFMVRAGGKTAPKLKCANPTCDFSRDYDEVAEAEALAQKVTPIDAAKPTGAAAPASDESTA